jgi:hypothetical protein
MIRARSGKGLSSSLPNPDCIEVAIRAAGRRPPETDTQANKKAYSERVSNSLAPAIAAELEGRGLRGTQPATSVAGKRRGSERRIAGGLGDKKVDVTYASEHAGLILAISLKTISWRDQKTKNFQKNLQNRKADLVFEVTTLHKRFPYSVVGGILFLHYDAKTDNKGSKARISTFSRAHQLLKMFNKRLGTRNEDTKFEYLAIGVYKDDPVDYELYEAGEPTRQISLGEFIEKLLVAVAERNPEDFVYDHGRLLRPRELGLGNDSET